MTLPRYSGAYTTPGARGLISAGSEQGRRSLRIAQARRATSRAADFLRPLRARWRLFTAACLHLLCCARRALLRTLVRCCVALAAPSAF